MAKRYLKVNETMVASLFLVAQKLLLTLEGKLRSKRIKHHAATNEGLKILVSEYVPILFLMG